MAVEIGLGVEPGKGVAIQHCLELGLGAQHDADGETELLADGLFQRRLDGLGLALCGEPHIAARQNRLHLRKAGRLHAGLQFGHLHLPLAQIDAAQECAPDLAVVLAHGMVFCG
ncbi:hypothetical protein D9M68_919290 [compost metagenome]